jgi:FkbM family methyltransferase
MKYIFLAILQLLSKISNKTVTYYTHTEELEVRMAVKSSFGFWYCGNVFDQSDIAYGVLMNGIVEKEDTELVTKVLKLLPTSFTLYDVGANTGWYSMLASHISKDAHVHAFEPLDEHCKVLNESISLNMIMNQITIHKYALSNFDGESTIRLAGSGSSLESSFLKSDRGTRIIKAATLDDYIEKHKLQAPDFIKIDVEGHEFNVLQGASNTLQTHTPILFIEIAYTIKNTGSSFIHKEYDTLFKTLEGYGYAPYVIKNNTLRKASYTAKPDGVFMYLFLHKNKHKSLLADLTAAY